MAPIDDELPERRRTKIAHKRRNQRNSRNIWRFHFMCAGFMPFPPSSTTQCGSSGDASPEPIGPDAKGARRLDPVGQMKVSCDE